MAQEVEHLHKALSSNASTAKKKEKYISSQEWLCFHRDSILLFYKESQNLRDLVISIQKSETWLLF
jgi:hypothetical protein